MKTFMTAFRAELIKKRGTGLFVLSIVFGVFLPLMSFMVKVFNRDLLYTPAYKINYFLTFLQNSMYGFSGFIFPLLIIIIVSRITQLDHRNGGWQLMETQPLTRFSIYFSKFTMVMVCELITILGLTLSTYLAAWLLTFFIKVPVATDMSIPVIATLQLITRLFIASLFVAAFQYALSVIIPGFIWSLLIGIGSLLLNLYFTITQIHADWFPYQILLRIAQYKDGSDLGYWFIYTEYASLLLSILILYTGFIYYRGKTIRGTFSRSRSLFQYAIALALIVPLLIYTLTVRVMEPYKRTVLAGKVVGKAQFRQAYLINMTLKDTVATIPIEGNEYHYVFSRPLVTDNYTLVLDRGFQVPVNVFMGAMDSVFIVSNVTGGGAENKYTGTRLAENQYQGEMGSGSNTDYYLNEYLERPAIFSSFLLRSLDQDLSTIGHFKTVDNYSPRADFIERIKKIVYVRCLNNWNAFMKKRLALFPNEKTAIPAKISTLKKEVSLTDEGLLSNPEYFDYAIGQLSATIKEDVDADQKAMEAVLRLKTPSFRDKMLYFQLNKSLKEASNAGERQKLIGKYLPVISSAKFRNATLAGLASIEMLSKGHLAPPFGGVNLKSQQLALSDFKGKYVVLDVWATWCGPCRYESPYFEKFALKYKGPNVQFISLSTDESFANWYAEAKSKSPSVLQLHLNNMFAFTREYNCQTIPRFVLIDPDGNFVNSNLPHPSEQAFELLLRDALKGKG